MTTVLPVWVSGSMTRSRVGLHRRQQTVGPDQVVCVTASQGEPNRIAERINKGVDLGAQSSA